MDLADHETPAVRSGSAWTIAVVATLGMSVSYVDRQALAAIAPSVTKALAIDNAHYGWLLSAFSFAYLVGAPLAGVVVDRLGARRGFTAAVVVWSLVAGAHAFAASFAALFALRVLLGIAEAPSFPAAAQAIRKALPNARRPLAIGLLFTGSSLGAIVAAKLSVGLDATYGFRGAFAGTAVIGAMWIPIWLWVSRGAGLDAPRQSTTQAAPRVPWRRLVTSAPVVRALVAVVGSAPGLMFVLNWTSKYLVDAWGIPKANVGTYLIAAPLLFDAGAIGFGAIASRREGAGKALRTHKDLVLGAMLLASLLVLVPLTTSPASAMALCAAAAAGGGGLYALVTADMLARVPIDRTSAAGGMTAAAQSLAYIVAAPLAGWTIDRTHGYGLALVGLGAIVVPATLAFLAWPRIETAAADPS